MLFDVLWNYGKWLCESVPTAERFLTVDNAKPLFSGTSGSMTSKAAGR